MSPTLPTELVEVILEYVFHDADAKQGDLARCCRVTSTFLILARPRLYRVLKLRVGREEYPGWFQHDRATSEMVDTVLSYPYFAARVQRLEVGGDVGAGYVPARCTFLNLGKTLFKLMAACPGIRALRVHPEHESACRTALLTLSTSSIDRIELGRLSEAACGLLHVLSRILQHLELGAPADIPDFTPFSLRTSTFSLTSLDITSQKLLPGSLLELYSSCSQSLQRLTLNSPLSSYPNFLDFPNLHYLHLKVPSGGNRQPFLSPLPNLVCTLVNIKTLAISAPNLFTLSNIRTLSSTASECLAANLPPTLEALHFQAPYFFPSDLIDILRASLQAKKLREIGREPYKLHLGKRDRKKRPGLPTHEEEQELEDECRKRGVNLVALS
ncbi:hypothetical protein JCM11641_001290 [Rhodosporidiobolus odoratus]